MKIKDLEKAEQIVNNNPNLSWDGWEITYTYKDPSAYSKKEGMYKDNQWYIKEVYKYINNEWNIPDERIKYSV
jgi:hypothetical protein